MSRGYGCRLLRDLFKGPCIFWGRETAHGLYSVQEQGLGLGRSLFTMGHTGQGSVGFQKGNNGEVSRKAFKTHVSKKSWVFHMKWSPGRNDSSSRYLHKLIKLRFLEIEGKKQ